MVRNRTRDLGGSPSPRPQGRYVQGVGQRLGAFLLLAVFLSVGGADLVGAIHAQERPRLDEPVQPHPEGNRAISQLLSPFCPGLMLEVCPSPQAKLLRDTIQRMAHQGLTSDSLVAWMLATYGEQYRAVPQAKGSGLWAWIMPPLLLVSGVALLVLVLRRFRERALRGAGEGTGRDASLSPDEERELQEALEQLKISEERPF